jgi:hypothetical protein
MIGNYSARLTGSKRNLLALVASSVIFSAGCANMTSTAPDATPLSTAATIGGKIHGGNQPVVGATVTLWFAGQGSAAIQAATTTSDSTGSFSFVQDTAGGHDGTTDSWSCPPVNTTGSPLVYVTAAGGNTQNNGTPGQSNDAAAFIALYGECSSITSSSFVYMSEVTTVATMAAVQQFFNPANNSLAADGTGQQRVIILNLPNTVKLLADSATGLAVSSKTLSTASGGNIAPGVTVTATPETAKINTLANIISACINQASSSAANCTSLFSAAVPPSPGVTSLNPGSFPTATDTLKALYYIFTNPTNGGSANLATLFGLAPAVGAPYQPALATQPTDWTVGVSYASTSTCGTSSGGTGGFISSPYDINIDSLDNVWIANSQTGGNLSEISATGAPMTCVNLDAGASQGGATVDLAENVWFGAGTSLYKYNTSSKASTQYPVTVSPLGITTDGLGNVFFSTSGSLYELPSAVTQSTVAPVQISTTVGTNPIRLMPDFQGIVSGVPNPINIWVSSGSAFISQVSPSTGTDSTNGYATTPYTTSGNSYGITISQYSNKIYTSAIDTGAITNLTKSGNTFVTGNGYPFSGAGISSPTAVALDGRGNLWIPNNGNGTLTGSVSEISSGPAALSPSTGFQKASTYLNSGRALVIDQAGNVWVAGDGNNFVTEIVGAAVPVFQPYALGLLVGRFQTIP